MTINEALAVLVKEGIDYEVSSIDGFDYYLPEQDDDRDDKGTHLTEQEVITLALGIEATFKN